MTLEPTDVAPTLPATDIDPNAPTPSPIESKPPLTLPENVNPEQEKVKFDTSKMIEDRLRLALVMKRAREAQGEKVDIVEVLQQVWTENDGKKWYAKPRFSFPFENKGTKLRFDAVDNDYDVNGNIITLAIDSFRAAQNVEDQDLAISKIIEAAYHETEHIFNPGPLDPELTNMQEVFDYLGHPGEVSAHARQFAYRYMKEFPGEAFDLQKMQEFAESMLEADSKATKAVNYFVSFADPTKQEKYHEYGDVKAIHEAIVAATQRHMQVLEYFRSQQSASTS